MYTDTLFFVYVCLYWMLLQQQGAFVDAMLERMLALGTPPEFVMAMGDEASDEIMFTGVENFKVNGTETHSLGKHHID
jgi:trehalose-6-phosphatase